jgi:hypothetical protein
LSGLTKKSVYADRLLSTILGVSEGDFVSYADLAKGLSKYIADNNLRSTPAKSQPMPTQSIRAAEPPTSMQMKQCRDCGAEIPFEAVFCDLCGVSQ